MIGIDRSVIRNERKYSLTMPFWLLRVEEVIMCIVEMIFGMAFSSQIRSKRVRAVLKLVFSVFEGNRRCMIVGKYPNEVENEEVGEGFVGVRLLVRLFRSNAITNPVMVTMSAVVFRYQGIVIIWMVVGGMLYEMKNPAMILPSASRLIGLISNGLFSFIMIVEGKRGLDIRTK